MKAFSLRTIIDDILLIVRNNNVSESEDLSRAQIAAWILHHKAALKKEDEEKKEHENDDDWVDEENTKTVGPLKLTEVQSLDDYPVFVRKTEEKIEDLHDNEPDSIVSVQDQLGHNIQCMNRARRHLHYFRRFTGHELTYYYENGYIYVQGTQDFGQLENIWVKYEYDESTDDIDEDKYTIPDWMVPEIKNRIFKVELAFMIKMPSDDDNNATLDGIKPHGPQDQEK